MCADQYQTEYGGVLPVEASNLEAIAHHFFAQGLAVFRTLFVESIVPWNEINRADPNDGHRAIADFLSCNACDAVVSTNYDILVEKAANQLGNYHLDACLSGQDLQLTSERLLKIHGCSRKDRGNTVWCVEQLDHDPVKQRVWSAQQWLAVNLQERLLVVVGFWSDWTYLNDAFAASVNRIVPNRVVVVDISDLEELKNKAPALWDWADSEDFDSIHLRLPCDQFLAEVRDEFGRNIVQRALGAARDQYPANITPCLPVDQIEVSDDEGSGFYNLRRDLCGAKYSEPAPTTSVQPGMIPVGVAILYLLSQGAEYDGTHFLLKGVRIRVVRGDGRELSRMKHAYRNDTLDPVAPDWIVCAGTLDDGGVEPDVVRNQSKRTVVRRGYPDARWLLFNELTSELEGS